MGLSNSKAKLNNLYVSTCGYCREGVFKDREPYEWSTGRVIGISHTRCIDAAKAAAALVEVTP